MHFSNGDFIPNPFEYIIEEDDVDPAEIFKDDDLSTNFLLNTGSIIAVFLASIVLFLVLLPFSKLMPGIESLKKAVDNLMIAAPLRIAIEGALAIFLAVGL